MSKLIRIIMPGMLSIMLAVNHAVAADRSAVGKEGLQVEQVRQIRAIGQAVLAAKRTQPADPDMDKLRQRVEELGRAAAKLDAPMREMGKISLDGGEGVKPGSAIVQQAEKEQNKRKQAEKEVRDALERVRRQRVATQAKSESLGVEKQARRPEHKALAKVMNLEDEMEKALGLPTEERSRTLRSLLERLEVKPRTVSYSQREKTPTISTIVRHRE